MKFNTLPRRVAATGAVTALAAGALVGLTTAAAEAAPQTINYTCPTALGDLPVTLTTDIPNLPLVAAGGPYAAGSAVVAGQVPGGVTNHFVISDATKALLDSVHTSKFSFTSFEGAFGNSAVPAVLPDVNTADFTHDSGAGQYSFDANGGNGAFKNPKAGTWDVFAPASFSFVATTDLGDVPVTCTADTTPGSYGSQIVVVKNDSTTKVTSNSPVKHGAKAVIKAKVTAPNKAPSGKVTFKDGKKTIGTVSIKKGVAVLKKTLSKGKHTIKATYAGDAYTNGSTGKTTVTQK